MMLDVSFIITNHLLSLTSISSEKIVRFLFLAAAAPSSLPTTHFSFSFLPPQTVIFVRTMCAQIARQPTGPHQHCFASSRRRTVRCGVCVCREAGMSRAVRPRFLCSVLIVFSLSCSYRQDTGRQEQIEKSQVCPYFLLNFSCCSGVLKSCHISK